MRCEQTRELFADALYGELDDRRTAEFNAHLVSCTSCTREFEGLKQTLALMSGRPRVEPTDAQWLEFSRRLDDRLASEPGFGATTAGPSDRSVPENLIRLRPTNGMPAPVSRPVRPSILQWLPSFRPAWGYGIAAVLLVAFGIYMGRTFFTGAPAPGPVTTAVESIRPETTTQEAAPPAPSAQEPAAGERSAGRTGGRPAGRSSAGLAAAEAADATNKEALSYLERSRNLLIGLTNLDEKQSAALDLSRHQRVSRELYDRGNTLAVALNQPSQQQLRQLVQNLQIILLQLANMGVGDGAPAVELVRQSVDSKSILLKINLEAIRASLGEAQAGLPGDKSKHNL